MESEACVERFEQQAILVVPEAHGAAVMETHELVLVERADADRADRVVADGRWRLEAEAVDHLAARQAVHIDVCVLHAEQISV